MSAQPRTHAFTNCAGRNTSTQTTMPPTRGETTKKNVLAAGFSGVHAFLRTSRMKRWRSRFKGRRSLLPNGWAKTVNAATHMMTGSARSGASATWRPSTWTARRSPAVGRIRGCRQWSPTTRLTSDPRTAKNARIASVSGKDQNVKKVSWNIR